MGCINSKGSSAHEHLKEKESKKVSKKSSKRLTASSRKEEVVVDINGGGNDATMWLISPSEETAATSPPVEEEKKMVVYERPVRLANDVGEGGEQVRMSRLLSIRNGVDGTQVAAGWPSWLTDVAGEAIKGWIPRNGDSFEKLDKIGQGTYSSVYRARDLGTSKIVALKKVRFVNKDPESVRFMAREIIILRRLDHPNIMKLEGLVTSRVSDSLYLVFEYMEHDLTGLAASPKIKFTEPQIKCYMQQLLRGLDHCHSRGVLHRDIKCSNLLIGNNGNLKIADFGLANFCRASRRQPLTSRVVTLWYRPPELLLGATNYGAAVDLWSSGCILAELYAGKPILPGRTEVEQLHKIFKLCGSPSEEYWRKSRLRHATIFKPQHPYERSFAATFKDFPPSALSLLDTLLAIEPECRGSASSALQGEFFTTKPLPCHPSSLPKYPPSKEIDIKIRDEETRRQKAGAVKGRGVESKKGNGESKAIPAPDANAELQSSIQKRKGQSTPKSISEIYNPEEDSGSGFPVDPSRGPLQNGSRHIRVIQRGTSMHDTDFGSQKSYRPKGIAAAAQLSQFSSSVAVRGSSGLDLSRENSTCSKWSEKCSNDAELSHHLLDRPDSYYNEDEATSRKESTLGYAPKKSRIHHSGPLLPAGGNIEEILKEHEKQIQLAVRKAHLNKPNNKNGQTTESR